MMKAFIFIATLSLSLLCTSPAASDSVNITPGHGVGDVLLGQPPSTVITTLGAPLKKTTFSQQRKIYLDFGINLYTNIEFNLGFDHCFKYSKSSNKSRYPIYKIFFKDGRVSSITLSSYVYDEDFSRNATIDSSFSFYANKADMETTLGKDYFLHSDNFGYDIYEYLDKGITALIKQGQIRTVKIYPPFTRAQKMEYIKNAK